MRIPILNIDLNDEVFRVAGYSITGVSLIIMIVLAFVGYRYWFGIPLSILGIRVV